MPFSPLRPLVLLLATAAASTAAAQTPLPLGTAITYQGELRSGGVAASGSIDIEACLFASASPADTDALACTTVEDQLLASGGRFTLSLDFGAQFVGTERFVEMRVRPGASSAAYTALQPRQAIRPTPEALRAASAPWSGIAGAPAGFSDNVDDVGVSRVAAGDGLTTQPAAPGAGAAITGSGTLSVRPGGISATMIAPGAVGATQIDTNQVQARVTGSCPGGEYLRAISDNGTVDCASLPTPLNHVLDQTGNPGSEISLALRSDDRPVLAYYAASFANLRYYSCLDRGCTTGTARNLDSTGDVGRGPSIALAADGRPLVAYQDVTNEALKLYVCADVECTSGSARTVDSSVLVTGSVALMIRADGRPLIAYGNRTNLNVRVFDCVDATCSGGVSRVVATDVFVGSGVALAADPAGFPVVVKGGNAGAGSLVAVVRCADAGCVGATQTNLASTFSQHVDVVVRDNNRPLVATAGLGSNVRVFDCSTAACDTRATHTISSEFSERVSLILSGTVPRLAFRRTVDAEQAYLRVHRCTQSTCSSGTTRTLTGNVGNAVGAAAKIAVRSDSRPVIAHYDTVNEALLLHVCANPDCA